jgi:2-methylisocitrate lyase-like PEP mutase family enzyme
VSEAQSETIARSLPYLTLINMFEGGKTPLVPLTRLEVLGYRIVFVPSGLQRAAIRAMQDVLAVMRRDRNSCGAAGRMAPVAEREAILGTSEYLDADRHYGAVKEGAQ